MAHSHTLQLRQTPLLSLKPFFAIRDFILLLASAFSEAKIMEHKSRRNSGNW